MFQPGTEGYVAEIPIGDAVQSVSGEAPSLVITYYPKSMMPRPTPFLDHADTFPRHCHESRRYGVNPTFLVGQIEYENTAGDTHRIGVKGGINVVAGFSCCV